MGDDQSIIITKVMSMGIDTINNELDVAAIFRQEAEGEDRTVEFLIYEDGQRSDERGRLLFQQGYHVKDGKINPVSLKEYTVKYILGESTWISLITQRRSFRQLFWYGQLDVEGDYVVRDFMIWSKFFEVYGEKVKLPFIAKVALRPKAGVV